MSSWLHLTYFASSSCLSHANSPKILILIAKLVTKSAVINIATIRLMWIGVNKSGSNQKWTHWKLEPILLPFSGTPGSGQTSPARPLWLTEGEQTKKVKQRLVIMGETEVWAQRLLTQRRGESWWWGTFRITLFFKPMHCRPKSFTLFDESDMWWLSTMCAGGLFNLNTFRDALWLLEPSLEFNADSSIHNLFIISFCFILKVTWYCRALHTSSPVSCNQSWQLLTITLTCRYMLPCV